MKTFLISVFAIFLIISCSKKDDTIRNASPPGEYIAMVGPQVITSKDISDRIAAIPDYAQGMYEGEEGLKTIVDELIKTELLYLQARKEGMDSTPEYISKVENYKKFALVSMMFDRIIASQSTVSEKEAKEYYGENRNDFALPEQIKASHILVKTQSEAEEILKELRQGKSFSAMAKNRSIDTNSAENGGDLGFFSKGEMSPEFENVAFSLKKGETSSPVKSRLGYHIIKVTERKEGKTVEFSRVKDMIIQKLEQEKQQTAFNQYIDRIKNDYPVQTNETRIKEFIESVKGTPPSE